jgi:NAD(P)-dependent dehydrogenase (short-subunit alcohol dehydrogenase family)
LESSSEQIEKLRASFKARAQKIRTIPVDVTSAQMVEDTISQAVSDVGGVDILCCLAGIVSCVASVSATQSQFQKVIDVNLTGSFLCAQAVAKYMISQTRGGSIFLPPPYQHITPIFPSRKSHTTSARLLCCT